MFALIRRNISSWGYGTLVVLFIGCILFSISGRMGAGITYEQHILSAVSDHYHLSYFALPLTLLSCFFFIEDDGLPVIMRFGSYHCYLYKKWLSVGVIAIFLIAVQTIAILISGVGLSFGNNWNLVAGATETELFSVLETVFTSPIQAFICYSIFQLVGTWLIFGICMWLCHFIGRKWTTRIVVVLYILSVLWLNISLIQTIPLTAFNHLFILHQNLTIPYRFAITLITLLILFVIIFISVRYWWLGKLPRLELTFHGLSGYYLRALMIPRHLIILMLIVLVIVGYKLVLSGIPTSATEWIYTLFLGHGTGYFQVLPFLEMLITSAAPLYLLAIFVEQTVDKQTIYVSIRSKGRRQMMKSILSVSIKFLVVYATLWFLAGLLGAALSKSLTISVVSLLLYAVLMKFLDIFVQYLIMIAIYIFTRQVTAGFLVLIACYLLCIIPLDWISYLPIGLSSFARLSIMEAGVGISAVSAFWIVASMALVMMIGIFTFGYKRVLK